WEGKRGQGATQRTIGEGLELSVRCALTSQKKNPLGAWRYSPDARDADTSVSGAILMGLLAARNAGIEVPDEAIDRAIGYFSSMTGPSGIVGYSGGFDGFGESLARSSIATLVFSIAKRKDLKQYKSALGYIDDQLEGSASSWPEYARYYQAQALFQGNVDLWRKWNASTIRQLKSMQKEDGSFTGQLGPTTNTSMALLALALNYRFLPIYER
ncbi:MAG: squalene--hopene cyclase, partial [Pirellulaceae bacterium]